MIRVTITVTDDEQPEYREVDSVVFEADEFERLRTRLDGWCPSNWAAVQVQNAVVTEIGEVYGMFFAPTPRE